MFSGFSQTDFEVIASDGSVRKSIKGVFTGQMVAVADPLAVIVVGDELRRRLPNNLEEVYDVIDPVFYECHGGIEAHYQVKVRRKGAFQPGTGGNYTINVSGPNSRVSLHSQDYSSNIVLNRDIFENLRGAVSSKIDDSLAKSDLLAKIDAMESVIDDQLAFTRAYQSFVTSAANHMTVLSPLLPALTQLLG